MKPTGSTAGQVAAVQRTKLGQVGEDHAAAYLESLGWVIIERNWRGTRRGGVRGELDLLAWDGPELVVVEVKTRSGWGFGHPAEAVTPSKLGRIRRLAGQWLAENTVHAPSVRIDILAVTIRDDQTCVEHLRGVQL